MNLGARVRWRPEVKPREVKGDPVGTFQGASGDHGAWVQWPNAKALAWVKLAELLEVAAHDTDPPRSPFHGMFGYPYYGG